VGIHGDTPVNINLNVNNEKQDCKISTVVGGMPVRGGRVKERD
jgi:hypothetical protein